MTATSTFRDYQDTDFDVVVDLQDRARRVELAQAGLPQAFVPLRDDLPYLRCFLTARKTVLEVSGRIIGFIGVRPGYIAWLYLDPAFHGRGLGHALLGEALRQAGAACTLQTLRDNRAAIALYQRHGFEIVGRHVERWGDAICPSVTLARRAPQALPASATA